MNNFKILVLIFFAVSFQSCINYEQETVVKSDGSGSMVVNYNTKNFNIIGEEIFGFGFTDSKIRENFSSPDIIIRWIDVQRYENDTSTHVRVDIDFKNFYTLPKAKAFRKIKPSLEVFPDSTLFSYTILKDSLNAIKPDMDQFNLYFDFEFDNDILESNGTISGKKVRWKFTLADLTNDIVMTAKINNRTGGCGLFGIELFFILLAGYIFRIRNKT